ncbi:MAG: TonB-dependent receptor plug domain-containing protein [Dissulfuribacterales bacterium]
MKNLKLIVVLAGIMGLILSRTSWAEEKTEGVVRLEEVVVTATKTPKTLKNVPATVTIIGPEEIENIPARTVGDLLADLPGVQAYEPQGVGVVTPQKVRMRGIGFPGHTLIMLDGQPMNNSFTDFTYLSLIPIRAVERVEVIRGPFSALYGSSADGGVINIITKDGGKKTYVETFGQAGDFERYDYGADAGIVGDSFSLGMFYDHKKVDNYLLYDDKGLDDRNREHKHDRFHARLTGNLGSDTTYSFSGGVIDGKTDFGISDNLGINNHMDLESDYLNLGVTSYISSKLELMGHVNWLGREDNYYGETLENVTSPPFGPPIPTFNYKSSKNHTKNDCYRTDVSANYSFTRDQILTLGSEVVYKEVKKTVIDRNTGALMEVQGRPGEKLDKDDTTYSFYAQHDAIFADKFEFVLGCRYDHFESYGNEFSPKGTVRWHYHKDGNLKFSVGKGFKAPSLSDLYSTPWSIAPFIVYMGDENLEAEKMISYELSLEQYALDNRFFFRISPYYSKADDFITHIRESDPYNPGGLIMRPENVDKVKIKGVDVECSWRVINFLTLFTNYNYNETRNDRTDKILDGYSRYNYTLGARAKKIIARDWAVTGYYSFRYYGPYTEISWGAPPIKEKIDGYGQSFASAGVTWKDMISLKVDGFNLFNDRSRKNIDYYTSERNYLVELSLKYTF